MRILRRFLSALLAATFCLPNPAYGLRPSIENKTPASVSAGLEERNEHAIQKVLRQLGLTQAELGQELGKLGYNGWGPIGQPSISAWISRNSVPPEAMDLFPRLYKKVAPRHLRQSREKEGLTPSELVQVLLFLKLGGKKSLTLETVTAWEERKALIPEKVLDSIPEFRRAAVQLRLGNSRREDYYDPQQVAERLLKALGRLKSFEGKKFFNPQTGVITLNTAQAALLLRDQPTSPALRRAHKDGKTLAEKINEHLAKPEEAPALLEKKWRILFGKGASAIRILKSRQPEPVPTSRQVSKVIKRADKEGLSFQPKIVEKGKQSKTPLGRALKKIYGHIVRSDNFPRYGRSWAAFLTAHHIPLERAYDAGRPSKQKEGFAVYADLERDEQGFPIPDKRKHIADLKINRLNSLWKIRRVRNAKTLFLFGVRSWLNRDHLVVFGHGGKPHSTNLLAESFDPENPFRLVLEIAAADPHHAVQAARWVQTKEIVYPFEGQVRFYVNPPFEGGQVPPEAFLYRAVGKVRDELWKELFALKPETLYAARVPTLGKRGSTDKASFHVGEGPLKSTTLPFPEKGPGPLLTVRLDPETGEELQAWTMDTRQLVFPREDVKPIGPFRVSADPARDARDLVIPGTERITVTNPVWEKVWAEVAQPGTRTIVVEDIPTWKPDRSTWENFKFEGEAFPTSIPQSGGKIPLLQLEFLSDDPERRPQVARRMGTGKIVYPAAGHRKIITDPNEERGIAVGGKLYKAGHMLRPKSVQAALQTAKERVAFENIRGMRISHSGKTFFYDPITGKRWVTSLPYRPGISVTAIAEKTEKEKSWAITRVYDNTGREALPKGDPRAIRRVNGTLHSADSTPAEKAAAADQLYRWGMFDSPNEATTHLLQELLLDYHTVVLKNLAGEAFHKFSGRAAKLYSLQPARFWDTVYSALYWAQHLPDKRKAEEHLRLAFQSIAAAGAEEVGESVRQIIGQMPLDQLTKSVLTAHVDAFLASPEPGELIRSKLRDAGITRNLHDIASVVLRIIEKARKTAGGDLKAEQIVRELAAEIDQKVRPQPYGKRLVLASPQTKIVIEDNLGGKKPGSEPVPYSVFLHPDRKIDPETGIVTNGSECFLRSIGIAQRARQKFNEAGIPVQIELIEVSTPLWLKDWFVTLTLPSEKSWDLSATPGMATVGEAFSLEALRIFPESEWGRYDPRDPIALYAEGPASEDLVLPVPMDWIPLDDQHVVMIAVGINPGDGTPGSNPASVWGLRKPVSLTYTVSLNQLRPAKNLYMRHTVVRIPKDRLGEIRESLRPEDRDRLLKTLREKYSVAISGDESGDAGELSDRFRRIYEENQGILYDYLLAIKEWPAYWNTPPLPAGAEETREAGKMLREIFTDHAGRVEPVIAPALRETRAAGTYGEEEAWVRAFLRLLRAPELNAVPLPAALLSVPVYHEGPFGRGELFGKREAHYLEEEWFPTLRKTLEGVLLQLGGRVSPEDLGQSTIERLMALLFKARGVDGQLLRYDQEAEMYRWSYREMPRLLVPLLAAPSVDRAALGPALENPFRISNNEGNDAVQRAIGELLHDSARGFTDDPGPLQRDPGLLRPWILLTLATNLVGYSRLSILREIEQEGDLARYILQRLETPFTEELGGNRFIGKFLNRLREHNTLLVHLPDNNAELAASLKLAEVLLSAFPSLRISMIVKADNGVINDGSLEDARRILAEGRAGVPDIYRWLRAYAHAGRFRLIAGAPMHGTPLNLLPEEAVAAIRQADLLLAEGEANSWNLNGLAKEIYLGLRLKWPPGVLEIFGLDLPPEIAAQRPPAFFRIDGARGAYYRNPFAAAGAGERRTIAQTVAEQATAAGAEEDWEQRVVAAGLVLERKGWIASSEALSQLLLGLHKQTQDLIAGDPSFHSVGRMPRPLLRHRNALEGFLALLEGLSVRPAESPLRRVGHHLIEFPTREGLVRVDLRLRKHPKFPLLNIDITQRSVSGNFNLLESVRLGADRNSAEGVPALHMDWDNNGYRPRIQHVDLAPVWSPPLRETAVRDFHHFLEKQLAPHLRQLLPEAAAYKKTEFLIDHPLQRKEWEPRLSGATHVLAIPISVPITLYYRPDSLADPLRKIVEEQKDSIPPELRIAFKPVPASPEKIQRPGLIIADESPLPPSYGKYSPVPVFRYAPDRPLPPLLQMLFLAVTEKEATDFRFMSSWIYREGGQDYLAIAVSA